MEEKRRKILSVILAILLGISLFCNGWMAYGIKAAVMHNTPKNSDEDDWWWWTINNPR